MTNPTVARRSEVVNVGGFEDALIAVLFNYDVQAVVINSRMDFESQFPASRILCDARILSIFEGAAEIQAQVIARRLLDGSN